MGQDNQNIQIERLARALAASAGVVWERLDHYPGYLRGVWRSQAMRLIAGTNIEARPFG